MWNGKLKAITFSFDDAVEQDIRLVKMLNEYRLKATFNLNSGLLGIRRKATYKCKPIRQDKILPSQVAELYQGHEVAAHTVLHVDLPEQTDDMIVKQVEEDRKALEALCGYPIVGMAYPNGGNDDRVAKIIRENSPIRYARTVLSTYAFDRQENLLRFNPSVYWCEKDRLDEVVDRFLALETETPQLLYIWGHAYELDSDWYTWEDFERLCKKVSGRREIFYGTNAECLLTEQEN